MDYYQVLGVERTATQEEIKSAYRKKAMQFHPDRNPGDKDADRQFKEVQTAYDTLGDATQKARYDGGAATHPFSNIWESVFKPPQSQQERGRDIQVNLEVSLENVLLGVTRTITIPKREKCSTCDAQGYTEYKPCPTCHGSGKTAIKQTPFNIWMGCAACRGTGRSGTVSCSGCKSQGFMTTGSVELSVKVPPGVETGHKLRLNGYGEPSRRADGVAGDLNVIIIVKEHPLFKRHGVNLSYEYPVGYSELCLGGNIEIPTLGGTAVVTIPPNTADYTQFRLKGMGLPYIKSGKGDLVVVVRLVVPSSDAINSNKELFQKIASFEVDYLKKERERYKS